MYFVIRNVCTCSQECGNGEPTAGLCGLFSPLLYILLPIYFVYNSVSIYQTFTRYTGQCPV